MNANLKKMNLKKVADALYAVVDAAIGAKAGLDPRKSANEGLLYVVLTAAEHTARGTAATLENLIEK
jgi:hypothetical protein